MDLLLFCWTVNLQQHVVNEHANYHLDVTHCAKDNVYNSKHNIQDISTAFVLMYRVLITLSLAPMWIMHYENTKTVS